MHMRILLVTASTNDPSNAGTLAREFQGGIETQGEVETTMVHLKDLHIEQFSLKHYDPHCDSEPDFLNLQKRIQGADGVVIATPVWNFGVPGHLKNMMDRMGSFALDETKSKGMLNGKPFYLIFTGGAPASAWKGLMRKTTSFVPQAIRYFGGSILGIHFEAKCTLGKGKFGLVVHERPESLAKMRDEGRRFAALVKDYAATGKLPAKQTFLKHLYSTVQAFLKKM